LLDKAFNEGNSEKLLYIGNILKVVGHDLHDEKIKLLLLTSIIELMLTHNPDLQRYNVEDSINKQFQLKATTLIYLNDTSRSIKDIKNRLKTIYTQRSNVAHGNFHEIEKYIDKLSKNRKAEDEEMGGGEYFVSLITDLYVYIRAILEEYLKDRGFVEFLKDG
jgi:hypothetical protein